MPSRDLVVAQRLRPTRTRMMACTLALIACAALIGPGLGLLSPATATASTSVVLALPSNAKPALLGTSSNGQYFAYIDNPLGWNNGNLELHWYNQQTGGDVIVGVVADTDTGRISADGHHMVFTAWGSDPLGQGLLQGAVYEATVDDAGNVSYAQISPNDGRQFGFPSVSADGTIVSYMGFPTANPGTDYVWSSATTSAFQIPGLTGVPPVLSSDGSTVAALSGLYTLSEYSTVTGEAVRTLDISGVSNQVNVYNISADGSYGVGFSYGTPAQTGYAYFDFLTGTMQIIPNSFDGQCTGSNYSPIALSDDGQSVVFGSLSDGLIPDPAGGSLGYFSYDPVAQLVANQSGSYGGAPISGDCPSAAITSDGQTMFFVSNYSPPVASPVQAVPANALTPGSYVYIYKGTVASAPVPSNTAAPTISGTAQQGEALNETNGSWTNNPTSFSYQWEDCDSSGNNCSDIPGETGQSYVLGASDVGGTIRVQEVATNAGGDGSPTSSLATTVVLPASALSVSLSPTSKDFGSQDIAVAPTTTQIFTLTNTGTSDLHVSAAGLTGADPAEFSITADSCTGVTVAPSDTCTVTADFEPSTAGAKSASLTFTDDAGDSPQSVALTGTGTVAALPCNALAPCPPSPPLSPPPSPTTVAPANTSRPIIKGRAKVRSKLEASTGTWTGTAPIAYKYQWELCNKQGKKCRAIKGATKSILKLNVKDVGHRLEVVVTATNPVGAAKATSKTTAVVKK